LIEPLVLLLFFDVRSVKHLTFCYLADVAEHVVMLTVVILLLLFLFQQLGTSRVSFSFSPIMLVWFASISMIGLYNIIVYYPPVLKAVSPHYIYYYFARNGAAGWEQLGAIILCITGEPD
jgi:KUP system potassium uptake protein